MSKFEMPSEVTALSHEQQTAIKKVLVDTGLLTSDGDLADFSEDRLTNDQRLMLTEKMQVMGMKCALARIAEAAAVAACALIPGGGPIAIAACAAAAHEVANRACKK